MVQEHSSRVGERKSASSSEEVQAEQGSSHPSRRQFLKKSLVAGSAPVLMSLASRPVLANQCSISGMLSGNISPPQVICAGLTPGFWGQHPDEWLPLGYFAGDCNQGTVGQHCKKNDYADNGTLFHDPFLGFAGNLYGDLTMMQVIHLGGGTHPDSKDIPRDPYQLGAHSVAALLNAAFFGPDVFGYTPAQIRDLWADRYAIDPEGLKEDFEMLNERSDS